MPFREGKCVDGCSFFVPFKIHWESSHRIWGLLRLNEVNRREVWEALLVLL